MKELAEFVKELLSENYEAGTWVSVSAIKAGDTNNSFIATASQNGTEKDWYVRQYNIAEQEQEIIYEHAFEKYFHDNVNGEMQTMQPIPAKSGLTWVRKEFNGQENFYAVFNVISGEEPYSWEFNDLSDTALDSCAEITAKFQAWAYGFEGPEGSGRRESPLETQFEEWKELLPLALEQKKQEKIYDRFTGYFEKEVSYLVNVADFCGKELAIYQKDLKMCINHKDLNPGNVMFDENDKVIAVFDLDWVNTDYRLYDIAWMGYQVLASWDTENWGYVPFDKLDRFVNVYNRTMIERNCPLGPLNEAETKFLPIMMIIGAMKVITDFVFYEDHSQDAYRMFVNTWRFVNSVHYMREYVENNQ
ncbi:MAG: aminoglycoside phosphotransferase family protein [Eubacteriaceae bacterium]|jgi:Ser/Thr protein kinase RdoA (MazF antagonist)